MSYRGVVARFLPATEYKSVELEQRVLVRRIIYLSRRGDMASQLIDVAEVVIL
jgi:hypothetical protein